MPDKIPILWVLFDARAINEATILATCNSEQEAREEARKYNECYCFSFTDKGTDDKGVDLIGDCTWVFGYKEINSANNY